MVYFFLLVLSLILLFLVFYKIFTRNFDYWSKQNVPFVKPVPFFGNMFPMFVGKKNMSMICYDIHKSSNDPFTGLFSMHRQSLLVRDLELLRHIFVKDFKNFVDRTFGTNEKVNPYETNMLFGIKGFDEWKAIRNITTPFFTAHRLKVAFNHAYLFSKRLEKVLSGISKENDGVFDVKDYASRFITDVVSSYFFGLEENCIETPSRCSFRLVFANVLKRAASTLHVRLMSWFSPEYLRLFNYKTYNSDDYDYMRDVLIESVRDRKTKKTVEDDYFGNLVKVLGISVSDNGDVVADPPALDRMAGRSLWTFLAAAETSSSTLTFALFELAFNLDVQERARNEIRQVLDQNNGQLDYESVNGMKYLQKIINEVLRLYPVLAHLDRICVKDYTLPGSDILLKKGTIIYASVTGIHRDPKYYSNPEQFDPEHFSEENVQRRDKITFLGFGEGPRNCLGLRMGYVQVKLGLISFLKNYRIEACDQTIRPIEISPRAFSTTPTNKIFLKLSKIC